MRGKARLTLLHFDARKHMRLHFLDTVLFCGFYSFQVCFVGFMQAVGKLDNKYAPSFGLSQFCLFQISGLVSNSGTETWLLSAARTVIPHFISKAL